MYKDQVDRRKFIRATSMAGIGLTFGSRLTAALPIDKKVLPPAGKRVGIIGLDTSHSTAFVEALNNAKPDPVFEGYRVVAAYPQGSTTIKSSYERIPAYTEEVKKLGVAIVSSIPDLLTRVDVILLETNDGVPHLEQALMVMKAGKPLFVDKPVAASLKDVIAVFDAARRSQIPIFSASSLRYMNGLQDVASGKTVGKIIGAEAFSPAHLDSHHPDFFWYGIHGVETLYTMMGKGCREVVRVHTPDTDLVAGTWFDERIGTFRGTRSGANEYGGTAFGEKGVARVGPYSGYDALLKEIIRFFDTGISPVSEEETLEIYAFMEAADESKRTGLPVTLASVMDKAKKG